VRSTSDYAPRKTNEREAEQPANNEARRTSDMACRICGAPTEVFFHLRGVPVCCNVLWPNRDEAVHAPRGEIRLTFCRECGHIYNSAFDPARLTYGADYDNSLHFSPRFQGYARDLAARLVETYDLHKKTVIEIGCGNAEFLALLCALGPNRGIGFDPSFIPGRANTTAGDGIDIVADYYSKRYANRCCDFLCSRHMLEHVPDPLAIVASVSQALGENPRAAVYFEVPNALFTLREKGVWDIIYEHCSYFTPQSIYHLFAKVGFGVLNVQESFGGQFLSLEALVSNESLDSYYPAPGNLGRLAGDVAVFTDSREALVHRWIMLFDEMRKRGRRAIPWGAGAKGTIFLNVLEKHALVDYVVDINPHKQGRFVPGTGQQIIPPGALRDLKPDVLILMNPIYQDEVRRTVTQFGLAPEFITL
jgi:SAM-dependent methyltransferase